MMFRELFRELGRTVRYAIGGEYRTARLRSLVMTTAIAAIACYLIIGK